jgi:glycosyltransferase involved in cell wall biosynthesis
MNAILTLIVPTYNRASNLALLLGTLANELIGLKDQVKVIVGDNASTDHTQKVIESFLNQYNNTEVVRHSVNRGADENFCSCIDKVSTRHFWLIGDDDLPKKGVIRKVLEVLATAETDLLYLNSEWMPNIADANSGTAIQTYTIKSLTGKDFAREVNVWITFISGMVVNLERLRELNPDLKFRRFIGTNLVQLGWILPLLMNGSRFKIIQQQCILATAGNTGGYKLFNVFGTHFPAILDDACGSNSIEYRLIVENLAWSYLPSLIWKARFGNLGSFEKENILNSLAPIKGSAAYWIVVVPLVTLPRYLAVPFLLLSMMFLRIQKIRTVLNCWVRRYAVLNPALIVVNN